MLFYVYDLKDYRDNIRRFYCDFKTKAPGPLVKTTEEIIGEIKEIENNDFRPSKKVDVFDREFSHL